MIDPRFAIEVLLDGPHPALWDSRSKREVMRFLRKRGLDINKNDFSRLLRKITGGPPRDVYQEMTDNEWAELRDHAIWERLFKITESGAILPKTAQDTLDHIQQNHPWKPRGDRSEEFPFFTSSGWGRRDKIGKSENFSSMDIDEFIGWSETQQDTRWDCSGGWSPFCENEPDKALALLHGAGKHNVWPIAPWHDALSSFRQNEKILSIRHKVDTAKTLEKMPIVPLGHLALEAARQLEAIHKSLGKKKTLRRRLWKNIWDASITQDWEGNINYDMTLNHAGGILASVLLNELSEYYPSASAGFNPGLIKSLHPHFSLIGEGDTPSAKLARVRFSASLLYLFRIDQNWTEHALLRRMDLENEDVFEAGLWEGYLWASHISADLLIALKPHFFRIMENLISIPERVRKRAPQLFIMAALPVDRGITAREALGILQELEPEHLADAAMKLKNMLSGSGDKAPALWRDTIGPWFTKVWPTHENAKSAKVSESLSQMAMECGEAFPEAVKVIENRLHPEERGLTTYRLKKTNLHKRSAKAAWTLISRVVGADTQTIGIGLPVILDELRQAYPEVAEDPYFQTLLARG